MDKIPRAALLPRAKFIVMDLGDVKDLKSDLTDHRENLVYAMQVISFSHDAAQSAQAKQQAVQRRLERAIEENARKLRDAREELHRRQIENFQNRIYEVLKKQEEKEPNSVSAIAKSGNTVLLGALERNLIESGLPAQDVKTHMGNFLASLRQDLTPQPAQNKPLLNHGGSLKGRTGVASPVPKPSTRQQHNSNNSPTQFPVRPMPITSSEGIKILCVDNSNGARSILAATYLEVMRVWTSNTTNRWLFKRVASAGLAVRNSYTESYFRILDPDSSKLYNAGVPPDTRIMPSLLAPNLYPWSNGYPSETSSISQRMQSFSSTGITEADFDSYHYIICFNTAAEETLKGMLREYRKRTNQGAFSPQIRILPGCDPFEVASSLADPTKMAGMVNSIKSAIKGFLTNEFRWDIDACATGTSRLRTLQIVLQTEQMRHFCSEESSNLIILNLEVMKRWREITICSFWVAFNRTWIGRTEWLVSIIGSQATLKQAEQLVRGAQYQLPRT
ncbi:uncharacterized protein LY89DRAFT_718678 [Mollisia scopiformis]|uniref:Uncharacterized protein n=1 Tax=Mollisia scopiformis TaxID=149040 RepID=A0A194X9X5_MOLSC|nr:uncharacterized protein LY89DRAFT_718678 [Mollisia scopiformis]KUJ16968.1 hypothetical protein LY89DRAFT_718678 [Mollisia scopiformis]